MTSIDTPDFDRALAGDRDGSFHRAVHAYLEKSRVELRAALRLGVSPLDFERARQIETALDRADDVIRFSAQHSPSRQNPT